MLRRRGAGAGAVSCRRGGRRWRVLQEREGLQVGTRSAQRLGKAEGHQSEHTF
jgi:hypothetical protein